MGEVVGDVAAGEVGAESPYVGLGGADERGCGSDVAVACRDGVPRDLVRLAHKIRTVRGNFPAASSDYDGMTRCARARRAVSASFDGNATARLAEAEGHVAGCAECRAWAAGVARLATVTRDAPALPVPELSGVLLAGYRQSRRQVEPEPWLRWSLLLVALVQLAVALPDLLGGGRGAIVHAHRDLSAWDAAFAIGLLWVARRPHQAFGLLPFAVALAGVLAFSSIADMVTGRVPGVTELPHALALFGLVLLWRMTHPRPPHVGGRSPARTA